jgi:hypothetical protein
MATKTKTKRRASPDVSSTYDLAPIEERRGGWSDYEIREALHTIAKADKIRKNKPLMACVRKEAQKQLAAAKATITNVGG